MSDELTITECKITPMPKSMFDDMPKVMGKFEGEEEFTHILTFYPDEISFSEEEFIGLTMAEARALHGKKDRAYLTS